MASCNLTCRDREGAADGAGRFSLHAGVPAGAEAALRNHVHRLPARGLVATEPGQRSGRAVVQDSARPSGGAIPSSPIVWASSGMEGTFSSPPTLHTAAYSQYT